MYLPLRFVEQMNEYLKLPTYGDEVVRRVNNLASTAIRNFTNVNSGEFVVRCTADSSYTSNRLNYNGEGEPELTVEGSNEYWNKFIENFKEVVGVVPPELFDFMDYTMFNYTVGRWSNTKLTYKIDKKLARKLFEMSADCIYLDALHHLPADCFYVDVSETDIPLVEGCGGFFVTVGEYNGTTSLFITAISDRENLRVVTSRLSVLGSDLCYKTASIKRSKIDSEVIVTEDGAEIKVYTNNIISFVSNLITYLYASNRDVEMCESHKKVYRKPKEGNIKNKYSEVELYSVGYKISSTITTSPKKRYLKSDDSDCSNKEDNNDAPRKYASCYRAAHWHSYWTGTGDSKKRVVKWVDGIFIKGNYESDVVPVHVVK